MADKPLFYLITKMAAVIASIMIADNAKAGTVFWTISALSFACVFVLELLLYRIFKNKNLIIFLVIVSIAACFFIGINDLFPIFIILLFQLIDITAMRSMFYQIFTVTLLLSFFIFTPKPDTLAITVNLVILTMFCRLVLNKLNDYISIIEDQKDTINDMDKKLKDLKGLMKTLKYTVSVEERNRIAARLHDQIGHGISGSIIMLEAAMLVMKNSPDKAAENVQKAVINLREGVDEIRAALREERAERYQLGINDVTGAVEQFKVTYNKQGRVKTSGDLNNINLDMWSCIHDNLKECLTNLLKHSNATEFILNIEVFKKIIKVEYKDNGKSDKAFEKGLGLEAIEERTVNAKGRCFFTKSEEGFCVTNIFTY